MRMFLQNRMKSEWIFPPITWPALLRKRGKTEQAKTGPKSSESENDIVRAMGIAAWRRLTPSIRQRFIKTCDHVSHHLYKGVMTHVESSLAGWLLAQFCRLFGTPLAPHRGSQVPMEVAVYPDEKGRGVIWARKYLYPDHRPVTVRSAKILDRGERLMECVGGGFGMLLEVYEENRALHFKSTRYFWEILGLRLYLPDLISPGVAHVIHSDMGDDYFRFTITITHPVLGQLFYQDGIFSEKGGL